MSSIHIRDIAPETLRSLKSLARVHHRSLQRELHAILERAAQMAPPEGDERCLKLATVSVGSTATWRRDEIYGRDGR